MGRTSHLTKEDFRQQAEFRFMLRHFLKSAEFNARSHGLEPAQFQLLLAVRGMPSDEPPNVTSVAQRLLVETHTVVELVDKMIEKGMMERFREGKDRTVCLPPAHTPGRSGPGKGRAAEPARFVRIPAAVHGLPRGPAAYDERGEHRRAPHGRVRRRAWSVTEVGGDSVRP